MRKLVNECNTGFSRLFHWLQPVSGILLQQSKQNRLKPVKQPAEACVTSLLCLKSLLLIFIFAILSFSLVATPLALQSFENSASDTWAYSASPTSFVPYFWGRTNQAQGGASAQNGSWYWASWLSEANAASLTFNNVAITPGTQHSLSFYYYSKNLSAASDQLQICLEYDNGSQWTNWTPLLLNTQAWSLFSVNIPSTASTVRVKIATLYSNTNMDKYAHWDNFSINATEAEFTAPIVYNTTIAQRTDGSKLVDIYYDLFDANGDLCEVTLKLSNDAGTSFSLTPNPANLSGDIGDNIAPGFAKHIVWDAGAENIDYDGNQNIMQFTAEDGIHPIPENFVFVEGGTIYPPDGIYTDGLTVNSFYMDKYELTQIGYQAVMGVNPSYFTGVANGPVEQVSWFNAIEYSNRRSINEGLIPCYSYSTYGTNPDTWPVGWNSNSNNSVNVICNWAANGYRLPSKAEWEYAARGGNQTHNYTYSGSEDINAVAWYYSNSGETTHTVGTKATNELGIFDLSGNVGEWCWDVYFGSVRVLFGGSFQDSANFCTVSHFDGHNANSSGYYVLGFRLVRVSP